MAVVPDVSAILGQALDDEDATFAESVIAAIARDEAIVPTLFWYEIRNVLDLARRRTLNVYNATYLELAQRTKAPLATLDRALIAAAKKEGIPLFKPKAKR